jgi:hypothetical protein
MFCHEKKGRKEIIVELIQDLFIAFHGCFNLFAWMFCSLILERKGEGEYI